MKSYFTVTESFVNLRFDVALTQIVAIHSRAQIKTLIDHSKAWIDDAPCTAKTKLQLGQIISYELDSIQNQTVTEDLPQDIPLNIIYEDAELLVINKPAGLVVHPGAGQAQGTLLNGLLHYNAELAQMPRAGIVHRLDKMTTGLMVIAKTESTRQYLVDQLKQHLVRRVYKALVRGKMISGGKIETLMGRHPKLRKKQAVLVRGGKPSITHYRVIERFVGYTLVEATLETGRTHQIRVHLAHLGFPVVGDATYGGRKALPAKLDQITKETVIAFQRQALHASKLALIHPIKQSQMLWQAPVPQDMQVLIDNMTGDSDNYGQAQPMDNEEGALINFFDDNLDDFTDADATDIEDGR